MKLWKASVAGLLTLAGLALTAQAQIPTAPAIPGAGASASSLGSSAVTSAAGAAQPRTLWSFFGISKANCAACKQKFCASNLGMMVNGAMGPIGAMSGGLITSCCPTVPTAQDLQNIAAGPGGPNGAAAVAAKIKASEADAKARVAAVEYLGTVDCKRWPEASKALVAALRGDQNECVRYAAARVLNNGCCCTKDTIAALKDAIASEPSDKLPVESSDRVRAAAMVALSRCQFLNPETIERVEDREGAPPPPPVPGREGSARTSMNPAANDANMIAAGLNSSDPDVRLSAHLAQVRKKPATQILEEARRELELARRSGPPPIMTTGNRSLFHALARARKPTPPVQAVQQPQVYVSPAPVQVPVQQAPVMMPVPPSASYPAPEADPGVVGTSYPAAVEQPRPAPRTGGRSLVDILQRSRRPSE